MSLCRHVSFVSLFVGGLWVRFVSFVSLCFVICFVICFVMSFVIICRCLSYVTMSLCHYVSFFCFMSFFHMSFVSSRVCKRHETTQRKYLKETFKELLGVLLLLVLVVSIANDVKNDMLT